MNIGFYYVDTHEYNPDYRFPERGNPGIGGTEYMFLMLMRYLTKMYDDVNVFCYHTRKHGFPDGVEDVKLSDEDALFDTDLSKLDVLVFRCNTNDASWYEKLNSAGVKCVAWAHNFLSAYQMKMLYECDAVKRVVCVGQQHYDSMRDHRIFKKTTFIFNMFENDNNEYERKIEENIVTFIGSLEEAKGFGVLAQQWKQVVKYVPDAKLYILGGEDTYHTTDLQKKNKDRTFFEKCYDMLTNEDGNLMDSVHFLGNMGWEKNKIFQKTKVGVVNPSFKHETFCIAAVELEVCGIPVVSASRYGLLDTVINGKTGILYNHESQLAGSIVKLLKNTELNIQFGNNAKKYVERFSPEVICPQWYELFTSVISDEKCKKIPVQNYHFKNLKWLRTINITGISIIEIRSFAIKCIKKFLRI